MSTETPSATPSPTERKRHAVANRYAECHTDTNGHTERYADTDQHTERCSCRAASLLSADDVQPTSNSDPNEYAESYANSLAGRYPWCGDL